MPELAPGKRGSGYAVAAGVTLRRRYAKADAGPTCTECPFPIVQALADVGETSHPTCSGEFLDMLEASRAAYERLDRTPPAGTEPRTAPTGDVIPPITPKQLTYLHTLASDLGMDRPAKLDLATRTVGREVTSTNQLDRREANQVIEELLTRING